MKITKLKIKNLFGIEEFSADGSSLELTGTNGTGKSSVLDAIKYALTNKSDRKYIIKSGETEGEIIIETDAGISINRRPRNGQADYKSVKRDGREVGGPESFLKEIFQPLQLDPVGFMQMSEREQSRILLDMIDYQWDMNSIKEWFGEIPAWINYDQNILSVLADIQSEDGDYFKERQDINRDMRNKRAFIEDIRKSLPPDYNGDEWANISLSDTYRQIEEKRSRNSRIEEAKRIVEGEAAKMRKFDADREIALAALDREYANTEKTLQTDIARMEEQLTALRAQLAGLGAQKKDKQAVINSQHEATVQKYVAQADAVRELAGMEPEDISALSAHAQYVEKMKGHVSEYNRMKRLDEEVKDLQQQSLALTTKIEKARSLPGEILEQAAIPIKGLTVKDGVPLINGLPVSNLSEGEKFDLCVDVAIQNPNSLQIILIDGVEKLSTSMREKLYQRCRDKGLQFIATRTTDEDQLNVITLN